MTNIRVPKMDITKALPYPEILSAIQAYMSLNHKDIVNKNDMTKDEEFLLKRQMEMYLLEQSISHTDMPMTALVNCLYRDMKQFSFLTPYLEPEKIEELGLEEIRVNSWDSIYIITAKEGKIRLKDKFISPTHAQDIIKRLLQHSNMIIDNTMPYALGHIGKNQRIAAFLSPILDEEIGISATIRIVSFSKLTRENLIEWKTATPEMLDFLEMCLAHGVSLCISGATGSGKTGTLGCILSRIFADSKKRLITIEEGSREFDLVRRDENGKVMNEAVHLLTRKSDDEKYNITQNILLEQVLRHSPSIIGIGEMRSVEAFTAIEASYTDHSIGTTTHARGAKQTYERMVMLAAKGTDSFTEESLFRKAIEAFPIIAHQQSLPDGSRRIMEIIEGLDYRDGNVIYNTLYRFHHERTEYYGETGTVIGQFEKADDISPALRTRLSEHGVTDETLSRFVRRNF